MNAMKAQDRAEMRAARQAELDACLDGSWPRDINDQMRWLRAPTSPFLSARANRRIEQEHAARICQSEIDYLDGINQRIAAGDPDLHGWEA